MGTDYSHIKQLETAADVTPEILRCAEQTFDDWFDNDESIDWERFWDRFDDPNGHNDHGAGAYEVPSLDNAATRKIQKHIRAYRNQG